MAAHFTLWREKRVIFATSAKCASQSIRGWITHAMLGEPLPIRASDRFLVSPERLNDYPECQLILFMRDPYRRLVSFYGQYVIDPPGDLWIHADASRRFDLGRCSFRAMLCILRHLHQHELAFQHHLEPQLRGLEQRAADVIVPIEKLGKGVQRLQEELDIPVELEHRNRNTYVAAKEIDAGSAADRLPEELTGQSLPRPAAFYDESLIEIVEACFAADLATYRQRVGPTLFAP